MSRSLYLKSKPMEVSRKMERRIKKTPFFGVSYFRLFLENLVIHTALELIQTDLGLRKLALILLRLLVFPKFCSPPVPSTHIHWHSMTDSKADLRDLYCSLLTVMLFLEIHTANPMYF